MIRHRSSAAIFYLSLFVFCSLGVVTKEVQAQEAVVLSSRLGQEISAPERSYFGMFSDIPGFIKARAFRHSADSIRFDIDFVEKKGADTLQTSVVINQNLVSSLTTYIDEYEYAESSLNETELQRLSQVVQLKERYEPQQVTVFTVDGDMFDTMLLYASDSTLVLWTGEGDYDWRLSSSAVVNMPLSAVDRVEMPNNDGNRSKSTTGVLILTKMATVFIGSEMVFGGGVGIWSLGSLSHLYGSSGQLGIYGDADNYRQSISKLRGAQAFSSLLPPESASWQTQPAEVEDAPPSWMEKPRRYHFSIGPVLGINTTSPVGLGFNDFQGYVATGFGLDESDTRVRGTRFSLGSSLSYDLNSRFAVGAQGVFAPRPKLKKNTEFLYGASLGSFIEYSIKAFEPLKSTSRLGIVVGGGVDLNWTITSHKTDFSKQLTGLDPSLTQERNRSSTSQTSIGAHVRAAIDHYLTAKTSLRLQVSYNFSGIDIPGRKRSLQGGAYGTAYQFEPYTIRPILVSLGYRWHY